MAGAYATGGAGAGGDGRGRGGTAPGCLLGPPPGEKDVPSLILAPQIAQNMLPPSGKMTPNYKPGLASGNEISAKCSAAQRINGLGNPLQPEGRWRPPPRPGSGPGCRRPGTRPAVPPATRCPPRRTRS